MVVVCCYELNHRGCWAAVWLPVTGFLYSHFPFFYLLWLLGRKWRLHSLRLARGKLCNVDLNVKKNLSFRFIACSALIRVRLTAVSRNAGNLVLVFKLEASGRFLRLGRANLPFAKLKNPPSVGLKLTNYHVVSTYKCNNQFDVRVGFLFFFENNTFIAKYFLCSCYLPRFCYGTWLPVKSKMVDAFLFVFQRARGKSSPTLRCLRYAYSVLFLARRTGTDFFQKVSNYPYRMHSMEFLLQTGLSVETMKTKGGCWWKSNWFKILIL